MSRSSLPRFVDYDEVYFADACVPLECAVEAGEVELVAMTHGSYPGRALAEGQAEGIRTVGYWDAPKPQSWGLDWHRNEGIEITYLERGSLEFATRDGSWRLEPGQVTVTRPWQEHRVGDPTVGASFLHWIIIDVDVRRPHQEWVWPDWVGLAESDLARLTMLLQHNENPVWPGTPSTRLAFETLSRSVRNPSSTTLESEMRLFTNQLLLSLLHVLDAQPIDTDERLRSPRRAVKMFLSELDQHLDHPWTLAEMARAAGLGRSQFSGYRRQQTNMAPIEYLNSRRVEQAARSLVSQPLESITTIALRSGFQSSQYFSTMFRKQQGMTPRDYRRLATESGTPPYAEAAVES